ncbi:hypothetical protein HUN23_18220, partial [Acinetobacter oleivorans]|uniref:hypothetical protein n=1 Tax=Acinetobacter oleivorans TaxID=1148157 RepID=UPI00157FD36A
CKSDQKKYPWESPPKNGPYAIGKEYPGFEILSIYISSISNAGGSGGHTPPFIAPSKHSFNATIWCEAENTVLGARGLYRIVISGTKQRIPSNLEERTVLQKCSDNIFKTEGK